MLCQIIGRADGFAVEFQLAQTDMNSEVLNNPVPNPPSKGKKKHINIISSSEASFGLPPIGMTRNNFQSATRRQKPNSPPPSSPILFNQKHRFSLAASNETLEVEHESMTTTQYEKRKNIMSEIVETEARYVSDLLFINVSFVDLTGRIIESH